jgi:hypothetical protein
MDATNLEIEISKVCTILDYLNGEPFNKQHWSGYHPKVYNQGHTERYADKKVRKLCKKLTRLEEEGLLRVYELEVQMWWRDHKRADAARKEVQEA